jgi:transaldolase
VFVKIPATEAGLAAIAAATAEGISVNVTLIFALDRYRAVVDAYLGGLERARDAGRDLRTIRSVASFFVSRVDGAVDARLDALGTERARALRGRTAVANARLAYAAFQESAASERMRRLAALGAHVQRPLWASTGVKDPALRDTYYVEELAAPDVVLTLPERTLRAVADHGTIRGDAITPALTDAERVLVELAAVGVPLDDVTRGLEEDGVAQFAAAGRRLLATVAEGMPARDLRPA